METQVQTQHNVNEQDLLLEFFKTFADLNRLRLAALLAETPCTLEEAAARLGLRPVDLPRQLALLEQLGLLINAEDRYQLDAKALEKLSRQVLSHRRAQSTGSQAEDAGAFDHKTVRSFSLPDGRLREIPYQNRKLQAILRHVVQVFEPGKRYTEKEVNEALKRFHEDYASLRRSLIDQKMVARDASGAAYWRVE